MNTRSFITGQSIIVPDPDNTDPAATVEAIVISSNQRTTHYEARGRKGWTYTTRVKAAQTGEQQ